MHPSLYQSNLSGMGGDGNDSPDLEAIAPVGVEQSANRDKGQGRSRKRFLRIVLVLVVALALAVVVLVLQVRHLQQRVDSLRAAKRGQETVTTGAKFCLSFPLVGQLTWTPAQTSGADVSPGYIAGDVAGLPPNTYVSIDIADAAPDPPRVVEQLSTRTNENGAIHLGGPAFHGPAHVSAAFVRVGTSHKDLRLFGPPGIRC